jgi:hypothetical protein
MIIFQLAEMKSVRHHLLHRLPNSFLYVIFQSAKITMCSAILFDLNHKTLLAIGIVCDDNDLRFRGLSRGSWQYTVMVPA